MNPTAIGAGLGLYAVTMSFLGGMLVERMRFDVERTRVLRRVADAEQRVHAHLMELERQAERGAPAADR